MRHPDAARGLDAAPPAKDQEWQTGVVECHGGKSTGPRTPEGLERCRKANWKHGRRSAEAVAERKAGAAIRREIKRLVEEASSEHAKALVGA